MKRSSNNTEYPGDIKQSILFDLQEKLQSNYINIPNKIELNNYNNTNSDDNPINDYDENVCNDEVITVYNNMDIINEKTQSHQTIANYDEVKKITQNENFIINAIFSESCIPKQNDKSFTLCSIYQNVIEYVQKSTHFTLKQIVQMKKPHALSIDISNLYSFPLILDIDHIRCTKQHNCDISFDTISEFTNKTHAIICDILKIRKIPMCIETRKCGIHIYFNCNVSIIMYEYIISKLTDQLSSEYNYLFDKTTRLPLPNSCKTLNNPYISFNINDNEEDIIFNLDAKFYDFSLYLLPEIIDESYMLISKVQTITNNFDKRWDELEYKNEILQTSGTVKYLSQQTIINRLLNGNKKINSDEYVLFNNYLLSLKNNNFKDVQFNWTMIDNLLDVNVEKCIILLANKIATIAYKQNDISDLFTMQYVKDNKNFSFENDDERDMWYNKTMAISNFKYIYKAMCGPSETCGYCFYILIAICSYLQEQLNIPLEKIFNNLELLLNSCDSDNSICNENIKHNFEAIKSTPNCIKECSSYFTYVNVFKIISSRESFKITHDDNFQDTIEKSIRETIYPDMTLDEIDEKLQNVILPYIMPAVKCGHSDYYVFTTKHWDLIKIKESKDCISGQFQKFFIIPKINKNVEKLKVIGELNFNYFLNIPQKTINFAMYKIFINTTYGVFNTITGMYMSELPLLYFMQSHCKRYCTLPMNNIEFSINDNMQLVRSYDYMNKLFTIWNGSNSKLLTLIIIIPGILSIYNSSDNLSMETRNIIMDLINVLFDSLCENDLDFIAEYFKKIVEFYKINFVIITMVMNIFARLRLKGIDINDESIFCIINSTTLDTLLKEALNQINNNYDVDYKSESAVYYFDSILKKIGAQPNDYFNFMYAYTWCILYKHDLTNGFDYDITDVSLYTSAFKHIHISSSKQVDLVELMESVQISETHEKYINDQELNLSPRKSFLIGSEKYNINDYSSQNYVNSIRGIFIVFQELYSYQEDGLPDELVGIITTLLFTFNFKQRNIFEYLTLLGLMYQPKNNQKKCLIQIGGTSAGKSYINKLMSEINGISHFSMNSCLSDKKNDANPKMIELASRYLIVINEMDTLSHSLIKCLTGEDKYNQRTLFSNTYITLNPIGFIVASTNSIPNIITSDRNETIKADAAIKNRLAMFNFKVTFVEYDRIKIPNQLLLYITNRAIIPKIFTDQKNAIGFSNLLYTNFIQKVNSNFDIVPIVTNTDSIDKINQFMVKNNEVYHALEVLGIVIQSDLYIMQSDIKKLFRDLIFEEESLKDGTKKEQRLKKLFKHFEAEFTDNRVCVNNQIVYIGLGLENSAVFKIKVSYKQGGCITQSDIRRELNKYNDNLEKMLYLNIFSKRYEQFKKSNGVYENIVFE